MDYLKILNIVRRYLWLIVLTVLATSLTSFFVLKQQPASYKATTLLLVGPGPDSPSPDLNALKIGGQLVQTYAELVDTRPFLESVNDKLSRKSDPASLSQMIRTKPNVETRVLSIIVYNPDPKQAVVIANAVAETLIEVSPSKDNTTDLLRTQMSDQYHQLEQIIANAETSIQQLETELAALKTGAQRRTNLDRQNLVIKQIAEQRARLSDALRTSATVYQLLLGTNTNQIQIIEPAGAVFPVGANQDLSLKTAMSGVAGLILALVIIFAAEYFDDRIRFPGDFSRAAEAPLLSTIDKHNRLDGSGLEQVVAFAQPKSRAANNYRIAVAKLLFSIGESTPCTFLLSSVGSPSGDDTAIATANLGIAFAQAGHRVILVDAQFHNPVLTELFDANGKAGLADLPANKSSKLKLVPLKEVHGVQFLPAGLSSEKQPGAMLNPASIVKLIEELQKEADIVLILGSPISWFAESLVLASKVNGVILVARSAEAHIKMVNEVTENLRVMNVQLAGVIFDNNPSPFMSKRNRNMVSPVAHDAPKEAISGNLQASGQIDVDATRPSDLTLAAIPADENIEPTRLDQVDVDTIQTPHMGNLPVPTDEGEVSSLAPVDVDPAQSPNLIDSITSTDEITSLEAVAADPIQTPDLHDAAVPADEIASLEEVASNSTQPSDLEHSITSTEEITSLEAAAANPIQTPDLEHSITSVDDLTSLEEVTVDLTQTQDPEAAAMPATENTVLPDPDQVDVDITRLEEVAVASTQTEGLEPAVMPTDENTELPTLGQVEADAIQSQDLAGAATSFDENLELHRLDREEVDSAQSPDPGNSAMLSQENLELALLDTNVKQAKANHSKNSNGSRRHRKSNRHS
jgi:capsular polysaccharide biosynthesis protein/Mrp family chromosome partitioning ATPase